MAMRITFLLIAGLLFAVSASAQAPVITSATPVVNQGATFNFTANAAGTWSCAGTDSTGGAVACAGSIVAGTGVYTAPATVNTQQSFAGYQLLPNNQIFNTRIDSLAVDSHSVAWMAAAGSSSITYIPSFRTNFTDATTPTTSETFLYTSGNNGTFQFPAYPGGKAESGWLSMIRNPTTGGDHHLDMVDVRNGNFTEIYDPMTIAQCQAYAGFNCTALSGDTYVNSTYLLPPNGATDAAGMNILPLSLHLQELEQAFINSSTIKHALRMTLQNGFICGSSNANACGNNVMGTRHIWPATAEAFAGGGIIPYGARFRLKSSFAIGGYSAIAQILLTQLKQYGLILSDGGTGWQITIDSTKWPQAYMAAMNEIMAANIATSNFEAVDESPDMISVASGECTCNREIVTFTRTSDSATASVDVALTGVTVALKADQLYFMAGTPAQQIIAYVNGTSNTALTWTMSPSVGTLGATGIYTAPGSVASPTVTTITATSQANATVAATLTLTVFPNPTTRLYSCLAGSPAVGFLGGAMCAVNYVDSLGDTWFPFTGDDGGAVNPNNFGGTVMGTDVTLYNEPYYPFYGGDMRFDIYVPNGIYSIVWHGLAQRWNASGSLMALESQGAIRNDNVDLFQTYGYQIPVTFTLPAAVTNNQLSYVNRAIAGGYQAQLSSISFTRVSDLGAATTIAPGVKVTSGVTIR